MNPLLYHSVINVTHTKKVQTVS